MDITLRDEKGIIYNVHLNGSESSVRRSIEGRELDEVRIEQHMYESGTLFINYEGGAIEITGDDAICIKIDKLPERPFVDISQSPLEIISKYSHHKV
tara:strand:- start:2077 stop:2367 length:291 start_codon:yes stop_codon:yes gene_type:complete